MHQYHLHKLLVWTPDNGAAQRAPHAAQVSEHCESHRGQHDASDCGHGAEHYKDRLQYTDVADEGPRLVNPRLEW